MPGSMITAAYDPRLNTASAFSNRERSCGDRLESQSKAVPRYHQPNRNEKLVYAQVYCQRAPLPIRKKIGSSANRRSIPSAIQRARGTVFAVSARCRSLEFSARSQEGLSSTRLGASASPILPAIVKTTIATVKYTGNSNCTGIQSLASYARRAPLAAYIAVLAPSRLTRT